MLHEWISGATERYGGFICMAAIIFGAQAVGRWAQRGRVRDEARRLRGAVALSLRALRNVYEHNLAVLAGGRPPLISGRNQIALLRVLLGRLLSLHQPEIEAVMAAAIAAEAAETAMGVAGTPLRGVAFKVPESINAIGPVGSALSQACSALEFAEGLVVPARRGRVQPILESWRGELSQEHIEAADLGS